MVAKVLVIAPHLDDEVLGCGGTIARHVSRGDVVHVCFVAHRVYAHRFDEKKMQIEIAHANRAREILGYHDMKLLNLPDERLDSCIQDIIIPLEEYTSFIKPQIIYSPFTYDNNQDHQAVARAVQVVLRPAATASFLTRWLMYETPSSTDQAPMVGSLNFQPSVYHDINLFFRQKVDAMQCYETEARTFPHPRSPEGIKTMAMKRGMEAGLSCAESFMHIREIN